jgi:hypothetical protein
LRGLGWLEIAAAMAKLAPEGCDLLRALYLTDRHALSRTLKRLKVRLSGRAGLSQRMCEELATVTLQAFVSMRTCGICEGAGHIEDQTCPGCGGEGVDHLQPSAVRSMLGVSPEVWEALTRGPFEELYGELRMWHEQARVKLARVVRG